MYCSNTSLIRPSLNACITYSGVEMPTRWLQGEHVAIIGETGSGKTFLETRLVALREYVVVLKTKADDTKFGPEFVTRSKASAMENPRYPKIVLKPDYYAQAREGWLMLENAWKHDGGWTVVIDELVRAERLGLTDQIERGLTQGRSLALTMMTGMQRPSRVTRYALSEAKHVFSFQLEGRDAKILSEATNDAMEQAVLTLAKYDFAYYNRATRQVQIGNARRLDEIFLPKSLDTLANDSDAERHGIFRRVSIGR